MKIAISGELGSGKSVLSQRISDALGIDIVSIGKIQRHMAEEKGMSTLEFNQFIENHPEIDKELDDKLASYENIRQSVILDSRLAWHFVPSAFKVHLLVDIDVAAQRVFSDKNRKSEAYKDVEVTKQQLVDRKKSEQTRFLQLYGVNINDQSNYDLVIDTTNASPEQIFNQFMKNYNQAAGL